MTRPARVRTERALISRGCNDPRELGRAIKPPVWIPTFVGEKHGFGKLIRSFRCHVVALSIATRSRISADGHRIRSPSEALTVMRLARAVNFPS